MTANKRALIVGAGSSHPEEEEIKKILKKKPFIISVDGGYDFLAAEKIKADLFLGDFDSAHNIPPDIFRQAEEEGRLLKFPAKKNMTDMELALEWVKNEAFSEITILGGLGSRLDHGMTNLLLMAEYTLKGLKVEILSKHNRIFFLPEGSYCLDLWEACYYISFIAYPRPVILSLSGFEYELDKKKLLPSSSLAISNHIKVSDNLVKVEEAGGGGVFCFYSKD